MKPDWSLLPPSYVIKPAEVKECTPAFQVGQLLWFRLRVNPTKRLSAGSGNKGKRVGIYEEQEQAAWLALKGQQHGFQVVRAQVSRDDKILCRKAIRNENGVHDLILFGVQFDGLLQVTDTALLLQAVENGIGSGKGFGAGLLSLAPAE